MKKIFVSHPFGNTRDKLIDLCIDKMKRGKGFLYILPSRESIYEVRGKILDKFGGILNSDIVTFYDLEEKNLKSLMGDLSRISDIEAKSILRKALKKIDLDYFKSIKTTKGFINQSFSILKILKRNNIKCEDEAILIDKIEDTVLKMKLGDIFKIYREYQNLKGELFDMDDISLISSSNTNSEYISSKELIIIDGYINIDPVDFNLIDNILMNYKGDVLVSIPFTNELVYEFIMDEVVVPFKNREFEIEVNMNYSPNNLIEELALKFGSIEKGSIGERNKIIFNNSPCIDDEVRRCGRFIKEKLLNDNLSTEDIAVVVNDENYKMKIIEVFQEYEIPLNIPSMINLNETSIFKEVLALLRLKDRSDDELGLILSSPFFTRNTSVYSILSACEFNINNYNELAEDQGSFFTKTEVEYAFNIYAVILNLLNEKKALDNIDYIKNALEVLMVEENMLNLSVNNIKSYLAIIALLDEIKAIRNRWELEYSDEELMDVLIEGAGGVGITIKKSKAYGVKILNTDHFKGNIYKVVCALGLNEGIIPAKSKGDSIFSISEREFLKEYISLISPSFELKREKIRFNIMLSGAKELLYLSYLTTSDSGEYMIESPYLSEVFRIIGIDEEKNKRTMRDRFNLSRENITSTNEAHFYCNSFKVNDFNLEYFKCKSYNPISNIKDLGKMNISPRKIENYGVCPFKFLVEDIMNLSKFNSEDFREGNICHHVLREYYNLYNTSSEIIENEYSRIFNEVLNNLNIEVSGYINEIFISDLEETLKSFIIADFEIFNNFRAIHKNIEVKFIEKSFNRMNVIGRVDRIDLILEEGEYTGEYIIHDYKYSSSHTDIKRIANLEKMQLSVYRWMFDEEIGRITGKKPKCIALLYRPLKTASKGDRTLHGAILKDYGKVLGFKGSAHFVIEENVNYLYDHLDEAIQEIRLFIKTGRINTVSNCNLKDDFMYPCPVRDLCREGV